MAAVARPDSVWSCYCYWRHLIAPATTTPTNSTTASLPYKRRATSKRNKTRTSRLFDCYDSSDRTSNREYQLENGSDCCQSTKFSRSLFLLLRRSRSFRCGCRLQSFFFTIQRRRERRGQSSNRPRPCGCLLEEIIISFFRRGGRFCFCWLFFLQEAHLLQFCFFQITT